MELVKELRSNHISKAHPQRSTEAEATETETHLLLKQKYKLEENDGGKKHFSLLKGRSNYSLMCKKKNLIIKDQM